MPSVKSAAKRMRQTPKRTERNRAARSAFRTAIKKAKLALGAGDVEAAGRQVQATLKLIGKTEKAGVIHRNKAARHASDLQKSLNALKAKSAEG